MRLPVAKIMVSALTLAFLPAAAGTADEPPAPDNQNESKAMRKGEELYSRMKLKEAVEQFREAIRLEPDNPKAPSAPGSGAGW